MPALRLLYLSGLSVNCLLTVPRCICRFALDGFGMGRNQEEEELPMTAARIIAEAQVLGLDPLEFAYDLADGYGWSEEMTGDAVLAVARALTREVTA